MNQILNYDRNFDIVSRNNDLDLLFSIKNFPIFYGCVDTKQEDDCSMDMSFYIGKQTGMVQINPLIPLDKLYEKNHSPGTVGNLWKNHHYEFSKFISKYSPKNVYEIGGGSGMLAKLYMESENIIWTILDPLSIKQDNINVINEFFDENTVIDSDIDTIIFSHVLEHIYDPQIFFSHLGKLDTGKKIIFSVPDILYGIANYFTNAMSFEHTYFCVDEYIKYWLSKNNFKLIEKTDFNNHSIFYAAEKVFNCDPYELPELYDKHKKLFKEYIEFHYNNIQYLNEKINNTTCPIFLFGAHIFSQFLFALGLNKSKIICILDNSEEKQNKRLYGSNLEVKSPSILSDYQEPVVILQAGRYTNEIKEGILQKNNNTKFIL